MKGRRAFWGALLALLASSVLVVSSAPQARPGRPRPGLPTRGGSAMSDEAKPGLVFRLSDGEDDAKAIPRPALAPASVLDEAATRRLLGRLPPLEAAPQEAQPF